ncbi:MAG TPA: SMP-30/gluconolactonase/LRE family protein [Steroidobacteraceae bacterium]|nr:SMP-30/gluconolactonase/LRE family protein [Steroidobacteraceae bacterium]
MMRNTRILLGMLAPLCFATTDAQVAPAPSKATPPILREGHGVRAADDARETAVLAKCKQPPSVSGSSQARARPPASPPPELHDYTVTEIPGVIAAGQRWKTLWSEHGLEADTLTFFIADGILAADDGGILIPQAEKSRVLELTPAGQVSILYRNTRTGGALSRSRSGKLFIAQRELNPAIWELAPTRKLLADRYQSDPLDCLGVGLNDLMADGKGGVYFTMGGLYYADPHGVVTRYGENLRTNGVVLSPDEKTLYVTNGPALVAFDVQPDGSLTRQRQLVTLPDGPGDGSTIDQEGRIYVSGGAAGVRVVSPDGKYLGTIPTPLGVQSLTFGGPGKQTLFALMSLSSEGRTGARIIAIPMLARGFRGRAK